jgi:type III restriction enzyme
VWINGLERIHRDREMIRCVDFSATPMYPGSVGGDKAWRPFEWVVSDFGLVDAIESGLVKVPRIPTDDDAGASIPKYRNLWEYVKKALPKRGDDPDEVDHPLIDYLSEVDGPLKQLAGAWLATSNAWRAADRSVPPVMIIVCNETKMAEMLEKHVADRGEATPALQNKPGERQVTVRIDSRLLAEAEMREEGESAQDAAARLRQLVSTVGKEGQPGEQVRCLISVGMLSEGWDARSVTQILGLRAFQSQLLCEQVVGRGLRRSDYSDLSTPEFVDVYGVPFQLLPFARATGAVVEPPKTTPVRSIRERAHLRLEFPRVEQIISDLGDVVTVDMGSIEPIRVSPENDPNATWVEFEVGSPGKGIGGETQDRHAAYETFRMQRLIFRLAADLVTDIDKRDKPWVFPQMAKIVRDVIAQRVQYAPGVKDERELCNLRYVAELRNRILACLRSEERDGLLPVLNQYDPIGDTTVNFQTAKPAEPTTKSHISHVVYDSQLELQMARALEQDDRVIAYAKNERVFFEIAYRWQGTTGRYRPDFLIKLDNDLMLVIEGKGRKTERDDAKLTAAKRWIQAVNQWGKLGRWEFGICFTEAEMRAIIDQYAGQAVAA